AGACPGAGPSALAEGDDPGAGADTGFCFSFFLATALSAFDISCAHDDVERTRIAARESNKLAGPAAPPLAVLLDFLAACACVVSRLPIRFRFTPRVGRWTDLVRPFHGVRADSDPDPTAPRCGYPTLSRNSSTAFPTRFSRPVSATVRSG